MRQLARRWFLLATSLLIFAADSTGNDVAADDLVRRGQAIVISTCGRCHAVGKDDASPHLAAPALRLLDQRLDLDALADLLRQGLRSGHEDMPVFRFRHEEAQAIAAYIRSIQGP
jgi:mono/diheme cytochrome c family protein